MEKYGFKLIYTIMISIQLFIGVSLPLLTKFMPESTFTQYFYFFSLCMIKLTYGGHFVIIPTIFAKIFGIDGGLRVYSVGFAFVGLASGLNLLLLKVSLDFLGYEGLYFLYSAFNLGSLLYLTLRYKFMKVTCCDLQL